MFLQLKKLCTGVFVNKQFNIKTVCMSSFIKFISSCEIYYQLKQLLLLTDWLDLLICLFDIWCTY